MRFEPRSPTFWGRGRRILNSFTGRDSYVDRDRLRRIIAEELARALADEGRGAEPAPGGSAGRNRAPQNLLCLCLTGDTAPCPSLPPLFAAARRAGWELEALPSFTFRSTVLKQDARALGDLRVFGAADDEAAVAGRLSEARAVVFPDISTNSLNKAALGIADSLPTRAIAHGLGSTAACVFLETGESPSPVVGLERLETLRRLERRGAVLARPEDFFERLSAAVSPMAPGAFRALSGQPVGRSPAARAVVTAEDVVRAARRGLSRFDLPPRAIVTDRAREEARRRGVELVPHEGAF